MDSLLIHLSGFQAGAADDEGNPERRIVGEISMGFFSVLAQGFSVVAGEDDDGVVQDSLFPDIIEQLLQGGVDISHFSVIRPVLIKSQERFRGLIGIVRVITVNPEKPGRGLTRKPLERSFHDYLGFSLPENLPFRLPAVKFIIINIEALVEPESMVKRKAPDKGCRGIALFLEMLGQRQKVLANDKIAVVVDSVHERSRSQENISVRRKSGRGLGEGSRKQNSMFGEAVDVRSFDVPRAVAAQSIGPQGVDRDQQQVEFSLGIFPGDNTRGGQRSAQERGHQQTTNK
jgi:hypothetical protein